MKKRYGGAKGSYAATEGVVVSAKPNRLVWFLFGNTVGLFVAFMGLVYFSSFDLALVMKHGAHVKQPAYAQSTVVKKEAPVVEARPVSAVSARLSRIQNRWLLKRLISHQVLCQHSQLQSLNMNFIKC